MIKVTVSVPVYNVEPYIRQCLDSLLDQTLNEIEIILVDDGSTDGSGAICDEYARKDSRIRVFHKENGGLASARQVGIENAHGEYYIVCDSDDWVEPDIYECMYAKAIETQSDMVICDFYYEYSDGRQYIAHKVPNDCSRENLIRDVLMRRITGSCFNKLVRRNLYKQYNLCWESGVDLGEDVFMFLKLLKCPIKVTSLHMPYYHYRRVFNSDTLTNKLNVKLFRQAMQIHKWKKENIDSKQFGKELFHSTLDYAFIGIRADNMPKGEYQTFIKHELPYKDFFYYRIITPKSILIFSSKLISLRFAQWVNRHMYKYWYK